MSSSQVPTTALCDADPDAISIDQARRRIIERMPRVEQTERVALKEAAGRVLAAGFRAEHAVPPFRASAMDGYALRHADAPRSTWQVVGSSLAGHPAPDTLPLGGCVRITTGARMPDDADTVVIQENASRIEDRIAVEVLPPVGTHVRAVGSNIDIGALALAPGKRLGAADVGILAACGMAEIEVRRPIRLGLLSTGDELRDAHESLGHGQIHDANRAMLRAWFDGPAVQVIDLGISKDTLPALSTCLERACDVDIIVSSGGVSVGDADCIRPLLERDGQIHMWKIAMKPGRPLTLGSLASGQPWLGLPGNPVSAALTSALFVLPALRAMLGMPQLPLPRSQARLCGKLDKLPGRVEYQRGFYSEDYDGALQVRTTGLQDSHVLFSLSQANCLVELPLVSGGATDGDTVSVIPFQLLEESRL